MDWTSDFRYALRAMRKSPGFTAVAVFSLALGIGANTAIFTIIDAVLLRWLPVKSPEQLYMVGAVDPRRVSTTWNYPDYAAFRDRNHGFSGIIAYNSPVPCGFAVEGAESGRQAQVAYGLHVSGNYFQVLGVEPALGRSLNPEDDRAEDASPYLVLSHDFWRRRFGSDARVIGRKVRINGYPFTIVGVSRAGFTGVEVGVSPDFFMPIMMRSAVSSRRNWNNRNNWWLSVMGRIRPGATIAQIEGELTAISQQQYEDNLRTSPDRRFVNSASKIKLLPGSQGYSHLRNQLTQPLIVLMIVVGVVLLIACANVANLLLARASARRREIAVRLAMGATRGRLARQLLTESVLLSLAGGAAGFALSFVGVRALLAFLPGGALFSVVRLQVSPDLRMLGFTLLVSVLTGLVFGLAPVAQSARTDFTPALKQDAVASSGRPRFTLRKSLVIAQVGLSLLLLIGAGLFVRSLRNLKDLDAGFRPDHVMIADVDPSRSGYKGQRLRDFYEQLRGRIERMPGVQSVSLANITPLSGSRWNNFISVEGYQWKQGERNVVDFNAVGPRFFETLRIPIVLGRDFRPEDSPAFSPDPPTVPRPPGSLDPEELKGPRVVIVNESMAKRFFAGRNPVGMRLCQRDTFRMETAYEIVGVVKDVRYFGLRPNTESMIYLPVWRSGAGPRTLCLRTTGDPRQSIEGIRREVAALDSTLPLLNVATMDEQVDNNILQERLVATLSSFFGVTALLLAAIGLYGVMAHAVTRRTREIGIRMALGAQQSSVLWLVLGDAAWMVALGAAVGIPAALAVTKFASTFLFGIGARDPLSVVLATAVLAAVAVGASYLPARRATKVDPVTALRHE
jgi:predicted permease